MLNKETIEKVIELNREGESTTSIANKLNIAGEEVGEIVSGIHPEGNDDEDIREEIEKIVPQSITSQLLADVITPEK